MREIWRKVRGYDDAYRDNYKVSNLGRVKRKLEEGNWCLVSQHKTRDGYVAVNVRNSLTNKQTARSVHRLVALSFIDNPDNLPQVNHIDENKANNAVDNLEWMSISDNVNYGSRNLKTSEALKCNCFTSNKVCSVDRDGKIECYDSIGEAERQTGLSHCNIVRTLKGRTKHCGNKKWFYKD